MTLRAVAAALLCPEKSRIENPSTCDDAIAGLGAAEALGAHITKNDKQISIKGGGPIKTSTLNCRESGLSMRLFAAAAALRAEKIILSGTGSLLHRPMQMMESPLRSLGVFCRTRNGFPPVEIQGPLRSGTVEVDGSLSSQFLTGLLMTLPLCGGDSEVRVSRFKSRPYVDMTLSLLRCFGVSVIPNEGFDKFFVQGGQRYRGTDYAVEGDWSGASFFLVAGAICGRVSVRNLQKNSPQADRKILEALEAANGRVNFQEDTVSSEESNLRAFSFDASECPDLFPPLTALACFCRGKSRITGVDRLKHKESDRAQALVSEFSKIGASLQISGNCLEIEGKKLKGGTVNTHNDHRIAMACAAAGLRSTEGVLIPGWQCVSKSYPEFFDDLFSLGGDVS